LPTASAQQRTARTAGELRYSLTQSFIGTPALELDTDGEMGEMMEGESSLLVSSPITARGAHGSIGARGIRGHGHEQEQGHQQGGLRRSDGQGGGVRSGGLFTPGSEAGTGAWGTVAGASGRRRRRRRGDDAGGES